MMINKGFHHCGSKGTQQEEPEAKQMSCLFRNSIVLYQKSNDAFLKEGQACRLPPPTTLQQYKVKHVSRIKSIHVVVMVWGLFNHSCPIEERHLTLFEITQGGKYDLHFNEDT